MPYPLVPPHRPTLWLAGCCVLALLSLTAGCGAESPAITSRFNAFGATVDLSLVQVEPQQAARAADQIRQDFTYLENDLNAWSDGPMGRVNRLLATGESFVAPPSVLPLVRRSQTYENLSEGLFNPAVGKLIALWGFNVQVPEGMRPPPDHAIGFLLKANPRMSDIQVDGLELRGHNSALQIDFSPIARGYAIDLAIAQLRELGIRHAQVQIGADLRAIGDRSGQPWRIPIRRANGSGVLATLNVQGDESVVTRTAHDRDFLYAGVSYHQILDPRSGRPARGSKSVTVIHPDATTAAAAAAALFVAGPEHWHGVAQAFGVRYALLVDSKGTVHLNPELRERLAIVDRDAVLALSPPLSPPQGADPATTSKP